MSNGGHRALLIANSTFDGNTWRGAGTGQPSADSTSGPVGAVTVDATSAKPAQSS